MYDSKNIQVAFDRPYITIRWDTMNKIVIMQWKSFVMGEDFRDALDTGLNIAIENNTGRWLADLRKLGVLSPVDQTWANNDWHPRATNAGINRMGLVMPERDVVKMGVNNILKKVHDKALIVNYFATVEDAHKWLVTS